MEADTPVIVSACRTPLGGFRGTLSSLSAVDLGSIAIRGALERAHLVGDQVDEVLFGNVLAANLGQAPATQAARKAGLPSSIPCTLVNKVCASSMKAATMAAQAIQAGSAGVVVVAGAESMSNVPHYLPAMRNGSRVGNAEVVDGLIRDGLWDVYNNIHMGGCAELCAERYGFTRQQQDAHAACSHERARKADAKGWTANEIVSVHLPAGGATGGSASNSGSCSSVTRDEGPTRFDGSKLLKLRPVFRPEGGTVTAGNASPMSDGAAALVITSYAKAMELGLPQLAVVRGFADANQDPEWFTTTPDLAVRKALARCNLSIQDIDVWEFNEAFSVVDLANRQLLGLSDRIVNMHGGAVALGHPLGASGARVIVTLLNVLAVHGGRYGCAAICNGGGGATAIILESLQPQPLQQSSSL